jgi:hypothetical protein
LETICTLTARTQTTYTYSPRGNRDIRGPRSRRNRKVLNCLTMRSQRGTPHRAGNFFDKYEWRAAWSFAHMSDSIETVRCHCIIRGVYRRRRRKHVADILICPAIGSLINSHKKSNRWPAESNSKWV